MKQLIQDLMNGDMQIINTPIPLVRDNYVLIKSEISLISSGTEKMLIDFGKAGLLSKAKQQPDKVRQVFDKIKTDGFVSTFSAVKRKLNDPLPLGYCNVGRVIGLGKGVVNFSIGDRVLSNGVHAEIVNVPSNLVSHIPDQVKNEAAVFGVIGAISLQSVRLMNPTIGETICVIGLGLVGHILTQILLANGCNVIAVEKNKQRLSLIKNKNIKKINSFSIMDIEKEIDVITKGQGVDGVIIATATKNSDPYRDAINITRSKGRIVIVGTVGMDVSRDMLFKKEISVQVSRSYGPGRYDPNYEDKNQDYPRDYVRWSAGRNFEAYLNLLETNKISVSDITTHKFKFENYLDAYNELDKQNASLGILLEYTKDIANNHKKIDMIFKKKNYFEGERLSTSLSNIGFIGSGNHAQSVLLPCLKTEKVNLKTLISRNPITGTYLGKKFDFKNVSCDLDELWKDKEIDTIFIATNHNSHSNLIIEGLKNNKNIYVEKPLCLNSLELDQIIKAYKTSKSKLIVGYNRRFAPFYTTSKSLLSKNKIPLVINIMINAGVVPTQHWVNDSKVGGGRVIGEMCHFIDLLIYLTGSLIIDVHSSYLSHSKGENIFVTLKLKDGSIGNIQYITNGHRSFPKERVEIFQSEKIIQINNFKSLKFYGWQNMKSKFSFKQDKGGKKIINTFLNSLSNSEIISMEEIVNVSEVSFEIDKTK